MNNLEIGKFLPTTDVNVNRKKKKKMKKKTTKNGRDAEVMQLRNDVTNVVFKNNIKTFWLIWLNVFLLLLLFG